MKLVEGGTLTSQFLPKPASPGKSTDTTDRSGAVQAVVTLAHAVQFAHDHGVLHRDLKPNNVLVDASGELFLTDFGLAKLIAKDGSLTRTLAVLGTPSYMAPEQARGDSHSITTAADVYGLGAILYELIAGRPPFIGATPLEVLQQVQEQDPLAPGLAAQSSVNQVPRSKLGSAERDLDTICLKCLEKDPRRRYPSARALAEELDRWLQGEAIQARQASNLERVRKWVRRKPAWAGLIATVIVAVAALGAGSVIFTVQVLQARARTEAANRELSRNLFVREWHDAEALVEKDKATGALAWFAQALRKHPDDATLATRLVALLSEHAYPVPIGVPLAHDAPVLSVAASRNGQRILTSDQSGHVHVWSVTNQQRLFTLPRRFVQPRVASLPDEPSLLVADRNSISFWPASGASEPAQEIPSAGVVACDVSGDGSSIALAFEDRHVEIRDRRSWVLRSRLQGDEHTAPFFLRLSRDGCSVLISHRDQLVAYDTTSGLPIWRTALPDPNPDWAMTSGDFDRAGRQVVGAHHANAYRGSLAVWDFLTPAPADTQAIVQRSPRIIAPLGPEASGVLVGADGSRAFVRTRSGFVFTGSLETGAPVMEPIEHGGAVTDMAEIPQSSGLVTASADRTTRLWDVGMRNPAPRIFTSPTGSWDLAFSPDESWFAHSGTDAVRLIETETGRLQHVLPIAGFIGTMELSVDGTRLAAGTNRDHLALWETSTGRELWRDDHFPGGLIHLGFSSDGRWLSVSCRESKEVRILEAATGGLVMAPLIHDATLVSARFSPDAKRLAVATTSGHVAVWDLELPGPGTIPVTAAPVLRSGTPRPLAGRHDGVVWMAEFSPDGRQLVTASSDHTARLWDTDSGLLVRQFRHEKAVYVAAFRPGTRHLFTGSADRSARLWDRDTGHPVGEPMGHPGGVWYASFSRDGSRLLTGDDAGYARLWAADTGLPLNGWVRQGTSLKRARLSGDARFAVISSVDQGLKIWRPLLTTGAAPAWLPDLAEAVAGRRLTVDGTIEPVPPQRLPELRQNLAGTPGEDSHSRWARWFFTERMQPKPPEFH